ncbi:MAG: hypothetical protein LUE63_10745 [Lachnospiraceae bacterium]|nr:hypothetical protein [Lachnospiraceae bacterium]
MQLLSDETVYVFAAGGTSHESYADCPFRVNKLGDTWANTLTVAGSTTIEGSILVPNSGIALGNGYGGHHYTSSGSYAKFEYVNASDQLILGNSSYATYLYGSSIISSKSITTSSDRRLKQNIQPLDGRGLWTFWFRYPTSCGMTRRWCITV